MNPLITATIVLYQNPAEIVQRALDSLLATDLAIEVCLVDNSPDRSLSSLCRDRRVHYYHAGRNLGFGAGHNAALAIFKDSPYHIVVNPDVYFHRGTLEKMFAYMESHPDVGVAMPKVLFPDGSIQYLCKRLPTPFDLFVRRFLPAPLKALFAERLARYEFRDTDYDHERLVPCLSGCFMFLRRTAVAKIGGFDERYFMYMEDVDLSRRMAAAYRTMYFPVAQVFHEYAKGSYSEVKLRNYHVRSAFSYFSKWGWFFDRERQRINSAADSYREPAS